MIVQRLNPRFMGKVHSPLEPSVYREIRRMEALVHKLNTRIVQQELKIRELTKAIDARAKREEVLLAALGMDSKSRKGERGHLVEVDASIDQLQDYLLKTGDRIESILKMLDTHREFLEKVTKKVQKGEDRVLMRMELDIMKNTITVLSMAGIEFDSDLVSDIDEIKKGLENAKANLADLRRKKTEVSKKFEAELGRYDLANIYSKRSKIPGYV